MFFSFPHFSPISVFLAFFLNLSFTSLQFTFRLLFKLFIFCMFMYVFFVRQLLWYDNERIIVVVENQILGLSTDIQLTAIVAAATTTAAEMMNAER